jgi:hypothetical protein
MKGKYLIYENDSLIGEFYNVLTTEGKSIIRNYLAGNVGTWAGSISIGAMNSSAPSVNDTGLEFEITRVPVTLSTVRGSDIVLSADIGTEVSGRIFELGVYPTVTNSFSAGFDDRIISNFSETWLDGSGSVLASSNFDGTEEVPVARIGYRNLILNNLGLTTSYSVGIDLSGYSDLDSISMLYKIASTGANKTVRLTFYDDQLPTAGTKYYDFILSGSTAGYKKETVELGYFTETGNFNNNVSRIELFTAAGSFATAHIDSIKLDDADETNPNFALISRALIGQVNGSSSTDYFEKRSGTNMTIQYVVEMN